MPVKTSYVKIFFLSIIIFSYFSLSVLASPKISADNQRFDFHTGHYLLTGNVTVETQNRLIRADRAEVSITSLEVWAEGNITLVQDDIYFAGDYLYVNGHDDAATIDGNVLFTRGDLRITSNFASFNWKTKIGAFQENVSVKDGENEFQTDYVEYNVIEDKIL